jgi:hypothetical protein
MFFNDNTLDNGLAALKAAADKVFICSSEPATYTAATSTVALGSKNFGAGAVFPGAIAAGSPSGRKLSSAAITDGVVSANGSASHYAAVTSGSSRLELANSLASAQTVTSGTTFALASFDVRLPNVGG